MLYLFRILAKLWAHTLKASLPCLPLPLHQSLPFPQPFQKHRHPCAPTNPPKTALSLAQHHILASLVKGRWIDGRHKLLLCCFLLVICPPFLYCKLFCRQDGGIVPHPHHQLVFPHYLPPHSPTQKIRHLQ